jgi:ribose transport system ATP-binding protein
VIERAGIDGLQGEGLTRRYGETVALDQVDIAIPFGQITGVVGENGAGKSTLLNILSGIVRPDSGRLQLSGKPLSLAGYPEAQASGIARVFQEQALIPNIPVYENLLLGHDRQFARWGQFTARREMITMARRMMEEADVDIDVCRRTGDLSFSKRQLVEIVRACIAPVLLFGTGRPVVLLDEPTASLELGDEEVFFRLVQRTRKNGAAILLVSHRLGEVISLADRIVVLRDGRRIADLASSEATERQLHRLMVGRERDQDFYHEGEQRDVSDNVEAFAVRNLSGKHFKDVTLDLRAGEVLGIGGLLDSGKSELGKSMAGVIPPLAGEVRLGKGDWHQPTIARQVLMGVGYVPAERLTEGMIAQFPLAWNISLAGGGDMFSNGVGLWRKALEIEVARDMIRRLLIKASSPLVSCDRLSGGNQQKTVLARWMARRLSVLILDNPTRGVDAGAKEEIYRLLRQLCAEGVAIILITDELLELIGMSNRIAVMRQGRMHDSVPAPPHAKPTEEQLVRLMLSSGNMRDAA